MGDYDAWLGRTSQAQDELQSWPLHALAATLGEAVPAEQSELPCPAHWLYFLEAPDRRELGPDGHRARGGFMPPLPPPRRMFAGARTRVQRPLRLGQPATLEQKILAIECKRPGPEGLWMLTLGFEYSQGGALCISEQRDIAYLYPARNASPAPAAVAVPDAAWSEDFVPDSPLLMRFSALTFNTHRIHYDRDYAVQAEGYPERVVHGPLIATLLAQLARRAGVVIGEFSFRARRPLFVDAAIRMRGVARADGGVDLTAYDPLGQAAMTATALPRG